MLLNTFKHLGVAIAVGAWLYGAAPARAQQQPADAGMRGPDVPLLVPPPTTSESFTDLPEVELTGEVLFQILAADFAAQRGAWNAATNTGLELARVTRDPRLAQRALEYALAGDNLQRAWEAARLWTELSPADPQARQAEIMLAAANGDTDNLAQALRQQIDGARDKADAIIQAQQILSRLTDKPRALELLDQILVGELRNLPEARAALAQSAYDAGDDARALAEARAALGARPDWELAAAMVLQFGMATEPDQVLASTRGFIQRHPDARELRLAMVSALVQRGEYDAANRELQAMIRQQPEDFELLYLRGAINYEADRPREAEKWLREYIEVESKRRQASADDYDPTSSLVDAQLLLARIAEDEGDYDRAYDVLGTMTSPDATFLARLRQATVRAKQGRIDEAVRVADSAQAEDERDRVLQALTRAQILREAGRIAEATTSLERAVASTPDSTELRYDLAMLYERQDRVDAMEAQLRQIMAIDPEHAHAYNALGYTLADRNQRLEEARALIVRALELMPTDPAILDSMGWVEYRLGNFPAAIEYLERSWRARPDAEVGIHLGEVLWVSGRHDEARQIWRTVAAEEPDNVLLRGTLQRFGVRLGVGP